MHRSKIDNEEQYQINVDGDIEAKLLFLLPSNGRELNATPFKISLELKPIIKYATIEKSLTTLRIIPMMLTSR